ncbi:uncharacterized protein HD556DRAFT_1349263, partial [Suillus plorans]
PHMLALLVALASILLHSLQKFRCADLIQVLLEFRYSVVLFKFSRSCRYLCWDHASFLAFENTMPNSWHTPTQKLA